MRAASFIIILALVISAGAAGITWSKKRAAVVHRAAQIAHGDPAHGAEAIARLGCVACHDIPGFPGTEARVGPPLRDFGLRSYIAGVAANTPDNLVRFLRDSRAVIPQGAMPSLKLDEQDARDIAAYLYTLE